jgi:hypothetical protein
VAGGVRAESGRVDSDDALNIGEVFKQGDIVEVPGAEKRGDIAGLSLPYFDDYNAVRREMLTCAINNPPIKIEAVRAAGQREAGLEITDLGR